MLGAWERPRRRRSTTPSSTRVERTVSPTDLATIFFTSGTTAQAKAVVHAHGALTTSARRIGECLGITPDDAWWGHMPLFWSGGFILGALATLAGGGRIVLQEEVDAGSALALLEAERCTIMAGWHQAGPLLEHPDFAPPARSRCRRERTTRWPRAAGPRSPQRSACTACARPRPASPRALGRSGAGPHRDVRPRRSPAWRCASSIPRRASRCRAGESGEILVKGSTLMEGYYRVPRAATFDAEGFFRPATSASSTTAGNLHFGGRLKDVIKTAGVNVAAVEVEEALPRHPAVKAAHVVGVADSRARREHRRASSCCARRAAPTAEDAARLLPRGAGELQGAAPRVRDRRGRRAAHGTGKVEKPALRRARAGADRARAQRQGNLTTD